MKTEPAKAGFFKSAGHLRRLSVNFLLRLYNALEISESTEV